MDEQTPHMHLCFTPITPDNRLCAKEIIGNRDSLIKWQDKFHKHMSTAFPELERGKPASETKRKHMPVRIYKQAVRLTEEMGLIKNAISSVGTFNAQKKKEDILKKLNDWIPRYHSFQDQLKPFKEQIEIMQNNNRILREEKERHSVHANRSEIESINLRNQIWKYEEFIESIPEDLRKEIQQRFEQTQEHNLEAQMWMER